MNKSYKVILMVVIFALSMTLFCGGKDEQKSPEDQMSVHIEKIVSLLEKALEAPKKDLVKKEIMDYAQKNKDTIAGIQKEIKNKIAKITKKEDKDAYLSKMQSKFEGLLNRTMKVMAAISKDDELKDIVKDLQPLLEQKF